MKMSLRLIILAIILLTVTEATFCKSFSSKEAKEYKNRNIKYDSPDKGPVTSGNLSVGKFYTFSRKPLTNFADTLSFIYSHGSKLTDDDFVLKKEDFKNAKYVGWDAGNDVELTIDLGRVQQVEQVLIQGLKNAQLKAAKPESVTVYVKEKNKWNLFGKLNENTASDKSENYFIIDINSKAAYAKEVKLVITPSKKTTDLLLLDEVKVLGKIKNTWRYVPSNGAFHGAFPTHNGYSKEQMNGRKGMVIDVFEKEVGKKLSMVLWYQGMAEGRKFSEIHNYREKFMSQDYKGTRFLSVGWLPKELKPIANGGYDKYFIEYFKDAIDPNILKGITDPIWIRPMNEFNGSWVEWSLDPVNFKKAWRRMYNIAEKIGAAQHHIFVWSPNYLSFPNRASNKMELYYPGDQYVDWVGVSSYPPSERAAAGDNDLRYPFKNIAETYDKYAHYKPFMIAEGGFSASIDKVRWVKEWFEFKSTRPNVKAVIWENHNDRVIGSSPEALELYRKMVQDNYWLAEN